ncbi:Hypothetical predicted protein [Paramuricea clavata]|uniref:Uncharacterized protein n=1 Tax=Paramuricea clavata TaxID=317549 RepID=A0A6S7HUU1_PARCT|nr:Hypothetical predicted protein [Paramuricea clavata]
MSKFAIHILVYVKNELSKDEHDKFKIGYEVEDNDECIIFTPTMFKEALESYAKDHDIIYKVEPTDLHQRLQMYLATSHVPPHVESKIKRIIEYIELVYDYYIGVENGPHKIPSTPPPAPEKVLQSKTITTLPLKLQKLKNQINQLGKFINLTFEPEQTKTTETVEMVVEEKCNND